MNPPPDQVATTAEVPVNRSRTPTRLFPGVPGMPCVADQEIVVWVTSCGVAGPVIVQIARGFRASVTSARTGVAEPCMTSSASWVAGCPGQLARMAAQAGTATGLGTGVGDGLGVGVGLGLGSGVGVGLGEGEFDGLERATTGPFAVQPASASSTPASANPLLTGV